MRIDLDAEQLALLAAVAAGRVLRHRRRIYDTAEHGDDLEDTPDDPFRRRRRARARLGPLLRQRLIELPAGDPAADAWPWQLTELGRRVLDEHQAAATATGPVDPAEADR